MKKNINLSGLLFVTVLLITVSCKQVSPPEAVMPVPSERQLAWHEMEQYAFIHFTTNTFTDLEWGFGDESPEVFNPSEMNTDQWVKTLKDVGLKGLVLTCKHHDGFCLWPSEYTEHSVKSSKWQNGQGNVVKAVRESCEKYGLKFGVYLSPWDRNRADYGTPSYLEYYRNQLRELFAAYGPVFEMWFDGANGGDGYYGGAREKRSIDGGTYYDWPTTIKLVQEMEPNIVFFSDAGPDIRWCGNEKGYAGETNWSLLTTDTIYAGKPGLNDLLNHGSIDGESWLPAEVDVSIRPGWFYHESEDSLVKSPEELFNIYLSSVGRNANLILNIPPDRRGLLHENDVKSLYGWKEIMDESFAVNIAPEAKVATDSYRGNCKNYAASNVNDDNKETFWATDDQVLTGELVFEFDSPKLIKFITLQEYIKLGQRVKEFTVDAWIDDNWVEVADETTIGYKRIIRLDEPIETSKLKISINDAKACPVISNIEIY